MQSHENGKAKASGNLHGEVLSKIRQMILDGELEPGARIIERPLCERLRVSRTPLREAFKVLAAEGLIELLPNRGARIPSFRKEDICEGLQIMGALEGLAGEIAAERAADDLIAEIRAAHYQMYAHYLRHEITQYYGANQSIHRRIVEAAGSQLLLASHRALSIRVTRARYLMNLWDQSGWPEAVKAHEGILDALMRRSGAELGRRLREHMNQQAHRVEEHFAELERLGAAPAGQPSESVLAGHQSASRSANRERQSKTEAVTPDVPVAGK
jgi:DNA-binding GntR family transcriptional regulator